MSKKKTYRTAAIATRKLLRLNYGQTVAVLCQGSTVAYVRPHGTQGSKLVYLSDLFFGV